MFPEDAADLLKKTKNTMTNLSEYHLAMAMMGYNTKFHLNTILKSHQPQSPLQATRIYFAGRELTDYKDKWRGLCRRFGGNEIFQAVVESLEGRWAFNLEKV